MAKRKTSKKAPKKKTKAKAAKKAAKPAPKNKKTEDKRQALLDFIARFSANASKSRQATARKKAASTLP